MLKRRSSSASAILLTVPEVAALLAVGKSKVAALIREGDLPSLKIGRDRRVRRSAVEQYVTDLESGLRSRRKYGRKAA